MSSTILIPGNPYVLFEYTVTLLGFLLQLAIAIKAVYQAYKKPKYNTLIAVSIIIFLIAFIPLLRSTALTMTDVYDPQDLLQRQSELVLQKRLHNLFFCCSTLLYTVVIQTRIQCIRGLLGYPKYFDYLGLMLTAVLWIALCLVYVIIYPFLNSASPILYGNIWSIYCLLVDNFVAFLFLKTIFVQRADTRIAVSKSQIKERRIMVLSLIAVGLCNWICVAIPFIGLNGSEQMRRLTYRIGFSCSPLIFLSALMFVNCVRVLFAPSNDPDAHSNSKDGRSSASTGASTSDSVETKA